MTRLRWIDRAGRRRRSSQLGWHSAPSASSPSPRRGSFLRWSQAWRTRRIHGRMRLSDLLCRARTTPMIARDTAPLRRAILIAVLLLAGILLHYANPPILLSVVAWFVLACAVGAIAGHWLAVVLAPIPWMCGLSLGLLTARYTYLTQEAGIIGILYSIVPGVVGIALGVIFRQLQE